MPPRPFWPGYIPPSGLSLLCGGHRYDTEGVTLDIASRVTRGHHWPGGGGPAPMGDVLVIADDDPAEATVPGLRSHGADLGASGSWSGTSGRRSPSTRCTRSSWRRMSARTSASW